jgi:hypothetical protein
MKMNVKSLLKDKNVLYVVLFLSVTNLFGYLLLQDFDAIMFFLILGFLTSYFSKNMIIVMLVAMIGTNFLAATKRLNVMKEGMSGNAGRKKSKDKDSKKTKKDPATAEDQENQDDVVTVTEDTTTTKESMTKLSPASVSDDDVKIKKPNLDYAATLEAAYDNLDKMLGSDAIKSMSDRKSTRLNSSH